MNDLSLTAHNRDKGDETDQMLSEKVSVLPPSATEEVDNLVKRMKQSGVTDIISLGVGEPCFDTPENIKAAVCHALKAGKTKYEPTAGDYTLREAICSKFKCDNGINVGVDDVMVTVGGKFAIFLAFQTVLSEKDKVLILDPAWVTYEPSARLAGADVIRLASSAEDGFQPDVNAIERTMRDSVRMIVINSPCNPTGALFNEATIRRICRIAKDHNAFVLSDEIYEHLIYEGSHYSAGSEFNNVITVNGFSKSYAMTGWRLGYVTAPPAIINGMLKVTQHSTSCVTAFAQAGAIEALTSDTSREAAKIMVEGYAERRALMLQLIEKSGFFDVKFPPKGAFYCFSSYRCDRPSLEVAEELLREAHVATVPGAAFGGCGEGHLSRSNRRDHRPHAKRVMAGQ
jgi:aspartate aminotransferase